MKCKHMLTAAMLLVSTSGIAQNWGINDSRTETRNDAGLSRLNGAQSGFFQTEFPTNYPAGANGWWYLLDVRHHNTDNNFAMQFSGGFFDQNLFFRKAGAFSTSSATNAWSRVVLEDPSGKASAGRLLSRSLAYVDNDKFNYNNGNHTYSINNYGLEWSGDSWFDGGPTAWLSGFGGMKFFTGAQCRMSISPFGNIGIGTTSPSEKLSVDGTIACRRVKVTQSGWPDYVFNRNYPLRNLDAVESYINQHKHLPDVPAAAQVEKEGLNLGENQAVLLRKVEELTLYVIKLNKAVKKLEAENRQQKRMITKLTHKQ